MKSPDLHLACTESAHGSGNDDPTRNVYMRPLDGRRIRTRHRRRDNPVDEELELAWMRDGACRNYPPAAFFPSDGVGVDAARKICAECAVRPECREYALEARIAHGVWGGCSERERRRILKRRRAAAQLARA